MIFILLSLLGYGLELTMIEGFNGFLKVLKSVNLGF